jgi:hypothetical protein
VQALQVPQGRKEREAEQRDRAGEEAKQEGPEAAAALLLDDHRFRRRRGHQRMLALDHAAGDVVGDGIDDGGDVVGL